MVLHQHEATQFRTEMAFDPLRQWSQDRPAVRRYPAFSQVTGRLRRNHEILNQKRFMTFENRSWRDLDLDHLFFDFDPQRDLTPARLLPQFPRPRRRGAFFHAARFDGRAALQIFQTGVLFAQFCNTLFQHGDFTQQLDQQSLKLWTAQPGKGGQRRHASQRTHAVESTQEKSAALPIFLPLLLLGPVVI